MRNTNYFQEILVAFFVFCKQNKVIIGDFFAFVVNIALYHIDFAAYYRFYSFFFRHSVKLDSAVHNAMVSYGGGGHIVFFCMFYNFPDSGCPVKKAVFSMQMQGNVSSQNFTFYSDYRSLSISVQIFARI